MAAAERKRKSRMLNKQKEMKNAGSTSTRTANESLPTTSQPFKRPQSFGKASKRSIRSLPQSPRKRKAVISGLAKRFCINLEKEMEASLSTARGNNGLSEEVHNALRTFYFCSDISYMMPKR